MSQSFADYLSRKRRTVPDFNDADLDRRFVPFYESGARIKVVVFGQTLTGTVGVTTGWRPVFLLMRSHRSIGSSVLLTKDVSIVAVQRGRQYEARS